MALGLNPQAVPQRWRPRAVRSGLKAQDCPWPRRTLQHLIWSGIAPEHSKGWPNTLHPPQNTMNTASRAQRATSQVTMFNSSAFLVQGMSPVGGLQPHFHALPLCLAQSTSKRRSGLAGPG